MITFNFKAVEKELQKLLILKPNVLPVLDHCLVKANGSIEVNDLEKKVLIKNVHSGFNIADKKEFLISKNDLYKIAKKNISFDLDWTQEATETIITINAGKKAFKLTTLTPVEEWPMEYKDTVKVAILQSGNEKPASKLTFNPKLLEKTAILKNQFRVDDVAKWPAYLLTMNKNDDLRPNLMSLAYANGSIVSTDAHVMLFEKKENQLSESVPEFTVMITRTDVEFIKSLNSLEYDTSIEYLTSSPKDVKKYLNELIKEDTTDYKTLTVLELESSNVTRNLILKSKNYDIKVRLVPGKYPNFKAVIPQENTFTYSENLKVFKDSSEAAADWANPYKKIIRFDFSTTESFIKSEDIDRGTSFKDEISGKYKGEPLTIGFDHSKLETALKALVLLNKKEETITITLSAPNRAAIINEKVLVMPYALPN